ncbi:MAG: ABC transporter ATP-binding protein [Acidimicrobiales bacterium]|nr:ABC transporter ATP-binding protein [Actinomycetota bacterium]
MDRAAADGEGEPARAPLLACSGLVKRFGDRVAVDGVSFAIAPGETYGLLGPNGAGKTTTIRLVCGLLARDGGEVLLDGRPVDRAHADTRSAIGFVPQEVALYPDLSAAENLRFFGRLYGMGGADLDQRVAEVLDLVDLADRAGDRVDTFSGGMKRRLNIGAGLVHRPRLLVLDEPTVGVDPQSRHAILERVQALGSQGMAVLYTTHYMEEAERICDRVGIVDRGRLVAEGTRRELVAHIAEHDHVKLSATGDLAAFAEACRAAEGVSQVDVGAGEVDVVVDDGRRFLPRVVEVAERCGVAISGIEVTEPDLEAVFLHLTGTALRE